jgi:F0F1-type ATP synthase delta subunit
MTEGVQFTLEDATPGDSTPGWVVKCSDEEWSEALRSVLVDTLHLDQIPSELPFLGHQEIGDMWCVFASGVGSRDLVGRLVPPALYSRLDLDPYVAVPTWLRDAAPIGFLDPDAVPAPTQRTVKPLDVAELGPGYLRFAYGYFLSCERALRAATYWSVLPPGVPAKLSPLTCFAAQPAKPSELGVDGLFETGLADTEQPPRSEPDWTALELERPEEVEEPSLVAPGGGGRQGGGEPPADEATVAALSRRLRRVQQLWVASVLVLVVAGAAATWMATRWAREEIAAVKRSSVPLSALLEGLNLPDDGRPAEERIRAALRDLSTVAVQSGAWQEGLRSRGAEPEDVLGTLVDLSRLSTEKVRRLAAAEERIVRLAGDAAALERLADAESELQQLATVQPALSTVAGIEPTLSSVAARGDTVVGLTDSAQSLARLAERSSALVRLARQEGELDKLAEHAQVLSTLADQAAGIVTFLERRQRSLEVLSDRSEELVALADASASVRELVARQRTIERLVRSSSDLFALAENVSLRQLAERRELLAELERNLTELSALAANAPALLELAESPSPPPDQ